MKLLKTFTTEQVKYIYIIYFLYLDEEVVYIGESGVGLSRPFSHIKNKFFDRIEIYDAPKNKHLRIQKEKELILKYRPMYNKIKNSVTPYGYISVNSFRTILHKNNRYDITKSLKNLLKLGHIKNKVIDGRFYVSTKELNKYIS